MPSREAVRGTQNAFSIHFQQIKTFVHNKAILKIVIYKKDSID
jgi:hypothetical protein